MKRSRATRGFSLLEVIIAVGLFAAAVTVIIGLIAGLSRQGTEANEVLGRAASARAA
jgi:prepilin-type N-terminal cleavage/methylation domain-containing protein